MFTESRRARHKWSIRRRLFQGVHPTISNKEEFLNNIDKHIEDNLEEKAQVHEELKVFDIDNLKINYYKRSIFGTRRRIEESAKGCSFQVKEISKEIAINLLMDFLQEETFKEK